METVETNPRKLALTNALIWAGINIVIFLLLFYVMPDIMGSLVAGAISFLVAIGLAVYFCIDIRKKIGGYWSFKEALGSIFLMFFLQSVIVYFFTIAFGKIEPTYVPKMKEISTTAVTSFMEKMNMPQDKIDEALAKAEEGFNKQFNPGFLDILKSLAISAIMYFIGALIFAAIFKKEPPTLIPADE